MKNFHSITTGVRDVHVAWFCVRTQPRHEHIAARAAPRADVAAAAQRHVLAGGDASGDPDLDRAVDSDPPVTPALLARRGHDRSFAAARRARRHTHELAEERPLRAAHLAAATARR